MLTMQCRRLVWGLLVCALLLGGLPGLFAAEPAEGLAIVDHVEKQPFVAATKRLVEALEYVGSPLSSEEVKKLEAAYDNDDARAAVMEIQQVLDPHALIGVKINAESRVSVSTGPAPKKLIEQGWSTFLVKVNNDAGITPQLKPESPNDQPIYAKGRGARQRPQKEQELVDPKAIPDRFLSIEMYDKQPLMPKLSGLAVEYRIIQLFSRDVGAREAKLGFNVGQGTQDIGFRNEVSVLFKCQPAAKVTFDIKDVNGEPCLASFVIKDEQGRVYPNPARRLAPDFFFHNQIYRGDGESVQLPPGTYNVTYQRGPEYFEQTKQIVVEDGATEQTEKFELARWTHAAKRNWYSGDHHVHAAGCAHYDSPTEGVTPADMMRHILGEDLNVGCVLTWGPCWYTQKQFFEGKTSELSTDEYLMRYDVEVSGFPSSHAGHLCLLQLKEDDYPGTEVLEDWPSWTVPVLKWGKEQGGVVGYSHSGWGLALPDYDDRGNRVPNKEGKAADKLPDYAMPPFDGIGANEYIVAVNEGVCDFISAVDTPSVWELNVWYHTLNCGYRAVISGETDFPCIYGDKVGLGRIYVKLDDDQPLNFENWVQGLKVGRSYCTDGLSHVYDFEVNGTPVGEVGQNDNLSEVALDQPGQVQVEFDVAALLPAEPTEESKRIQGKRLDEKPYWHLERSRIEDTRKVPVEIIVNGYPAYKQEIDANGDINKISVPVEIKHSSWVAVRIFPSVHTNPVFVTVDDQPIRASRRSAKWCREAVDVCWESKKGNFRESEMDDAAAAYQRAREAYDKILEESVAE
ncbi:MAG: CehA/McbA family metallohydrolase [Planctomycetaceae bacterium]